MPRIVIDLQSTALARASYQLDDEADVGTLDVTFTSGRTYTHENVPQKVFEGLRDAQSPGSYYNNEIKGVY